MDLADNVVCRRGAPQLCHSCRVVALRAPAIAPPHPLCPPHARVASALSWEMLPKRVLHGANCLPSLASRCCRRSSSSCCGDSGCRLIPSPLIAPVTVAAYGRIQMARVTRAVSSEPNSKKVANLAAKSWQRISIPNCDEGNGGSFPISEFLRHPSGLESVLNSRALQTFERLGANTYRCTLPTIRFLNFEVAPVIDLKVVSTNEDCTVEMLSLKFEGSEALEEQNQRFSASMKNHITWDVDRTDPYLDFDVNLCISLEVYTQPFSYLPISAVETPGNLVMQGLIDRLVPLFISQLLEDYRIWVEKEKLRASVSPLCAGDHT